MINSDKSARLYNNYSKILNRGISYFRIKYSCNFKDSSQVRLWKLSLIERSLIVLVWFYHIASKLQAVDELPQSSIKSYAIIF